MRLIYLLPLVLLSACAGPSARVYNTAYDQYGATSPCAAAAPALNAPLMAGNYATVLGAPGAREHVQAAFQIPGTAVICTGNYLRCLLDSFFPPVQPSQQLVQLVPASALQAAPACAPPPRAAPACAPPAQTPMRACPPPPVAGAETVCHGSECAAR